MSLRETITQIIASEANPDAAARLICGYLACDCCLDNGNGWYDDDPEMSERDGDDKSGLDRAEEAWLKRTGRFA